MDLQSLTTQERQNKYAEADPERISLLFEHQEILGHADSAKTIEQSEIINLWNRIHFMDGAIYVQIHHPDSHQDILVEARPVACCGHAMTCQWPKESGHMEEASIANVFLTDGLSLYLLPAHIKDVQRNYFTMEAPDQGYVLGQRQARRYRCAGIDAEVAQNEFRARGQLTVFSSRAFSIKIGAEGNDSFHRFDEDTPSTVTLFREGQAILTASCACIRQTSDQGLRQMVFAPSPAPVSRFLKKKYRAPRVSIKPRPNITFEHPLIGKTFQLDIQNLSASGFAVFVSSDEDVLMTKMILPDVTMNFDGALKVHCKAQVLNRVERDEYIRYGFVILDMDIVTYNRLSHIVMNTVDPGIHIADAVDADEVWELFFESGFIYPKKYEGLQEYRQSLKETYLRLYRDNPAVFSQVTYQRNGRIYGHVSMVHAYEKTWMVQHLAARPLDKMRTGLQILKQVIHYFDSLYCLPAVGMDYMMFYFRPENHFPDRFFGDFARHLNNPRACSLDLFSYLNYPTSGLPRRLPEGWLMNDCHDEDRTALTAFYRRVSNGLLMDVLHSGQNLQPGESLSDLYASCGYIRKCRSLSLAQDGKLKAVLIVNQSDAGLSLSDFLNGIKILVCDAAGLTWPILSAAVSQLTGNYGIDQIPLLIYPSDYLPAQGIPCEKRYNLWIMDMDHGRDYVEYRHGRRKFHA